MAKEEDKTDTKKGGSSSKMTLTKVVKNMVAVVIVIGLVQLFAYLGGGKNDPFIAGPTKLKILQTTGTLAVLVQIVAFIPAFAYQTERFYDLTGSATYFVLIIYTLLAGAYVEPAKEFHFQNRAIIISTFVLIWCTRLGTFLFMRVLSVGKDSRFEKIKPNFLRFLMAWIIQGLWVFLTAYCAYIVNASQNFDSSSSKSDKIFPSDIVGIVVWVIGFGIEATADFQKDQWRKNRKKNQLLQTEDSKGFIDEGLWYYSRHPNYFGEIVLWVGIYILAFKSFEERQHAAIISPIFVFLLLRFVSGVPLLEKASDKKFGNDERYQEYKKNTSLLVIMPKGWCGDKKTN